MVPNQLASLKLDNLNLHRFQNRLSIIGAKNLSLQGYRQDKMYYTTKTISETNINFYTLELGLDARKPVFGVCEQQRHRPTWAAGSRPLLFAYWKVSYLNLLKVNFKFSNYPLWLRRLV